MAAAMTGQLSLDATIPPVKLTARQQHALTLIEQHGPISSSGLGARMHARRGKHPDTLACEWCPDEGKTVARELRRKGLVRYKRDSGWYVVGTTGKPQRERESSGYDPATTPFPDGF